MNEPAKCTIVDNKVIPCAHLSNVYDLSPTKRDRGVFMITLAHRDSHKVARSLFSIKSGCRVEKGLVMNFCPFCGEPIFVESAA